MKIAEGCNRNCAFCAIPLMRGKQRSRPVGSIVGEVRRLAEEGVKEINLISQDTVNYGVDLGLRQGLPTLLRELVKVDGVRWIRPFYLYPQQVTDDLASFWTNIYPQIRKELRARYPKHAWPEDPWTAAAMRGPKRKPRPD